MDLKIGPVYCPLTKSMSNALLINEKIKIDVIKKLFLYANVRYLLNATKAHKIRLVNRLMRATNNEKGNININLLFY
jgi:hypothetical protein